MGGAGRRAGRRSQSDARGHTRNPDYSVLTLPSPRMSAPPQSQGEPITSQAQLVAYLEAGTKPDAEVLITTPEKLQQALDGQSGTRITRE